MGGQFKFYLIKTRGLIQLVEIEMRMFLQKIFNHNVEELAVCSQ